MYEDTGKNRKRTHREISEISSVSVLLPKSVYFLIANHTNYKQRCLPVLCNAIVCEPYTCLYLHCVTVAVSLLTMGIVIVVATVNTNNHNVSSTLGSIGISCLDDHLFWHAIACFGMSLMDNTLRSMCLCVCGGGFLFLFSLSLTSFYFSLVHTHRFKVCI